MGKDTRPLFKQNSELEVLLSAAVIFAALSLNDTILGWINFAINANISGSSPFLITLAIIGLYISTLLPISIVIHFALRVYWLSLIGLKSAFLNKPKDLSEFSPYFQKLISRKINLDLQIDTIDKVSSSIFAFSFLTLFAFSFSFIAVFGVTFVFSFSQGLGWLLVVLLSIYAFDFFSLGRLKKIKITWFQKIYTPVYWVFSVLTASFLYRGLYYNLINNVPKVIMGVALPLYMALAVFLFNSGYYPDGIYPPEFIGKNMRGEQANSNFYKDKFDEKAIVSTPFIQSFIIPQNQNYIELSIPISTFLQDTLLQACDDIALYNDQGFHWRKYAQFDFNRLEYPEGFDYGDNARNILKCLSSVVSVSIDDRPIDLGSFRFMTLKNPSRHLFGTVIGLDSFVAGGDHVLNIKMPLTGSSNDFFIPFYLDH